MKLDEMTLAEWLSLNAALQKKKNALRAALSERGVLKREGNNTFDHYTYFSEAQYKALFTELLPKVGLELSFSELNYDTFEGTEKQSNGRLVRLTFTLTDTETGFFEETVITGEGIDKGDKAGYKAYTGALKYYLADTFMVATGDDPEKESPDEKMNKKTERKPQPEPKAEPKPEKKPEPKATPKQIEIIKETCDVDKLLAFYKIAKVEDLTMKIASAIIERKGKKDDVQNND